MPTSDTPLAEKVHYSATTRYSYYVLVTLTLLNLLNYIDRFIFAAMIPYIQQDTGYSDRELGYVLGAFTYVYTILSPTFGYLGDRYHRGRLLAFGIFVWSLATAAAGFSKNFIQLLMARAAVGIGEADYATIAPGLLSDYFTKARRGLVMSIMMAAIPIGTALGYLVGGHFGAPDSLGWRHTLYLVGLPGVLAALAAFFIYEPGRGGLDQVPAESDGSFQMKEYSLVEGYKVILSNRGYIFTAFGYAAATFALGALVSWAPKWLSSDKGMTPKGANEILGLCVVIGGFAGTILGGIISDRLSLAKVRGANFWVCSVSTILAVPFMTLAIITNDHTLCVAGIFLATMLVFFGNGPVNALVVNLVSPNLRTTAMGLVVVIIHFLGDGISQPLVGIISTWISEHVQQGIPLPSVVTFLGGIFQINPQQQPLSIAFLIMPVAMVVSGLMYGLGLRTKEGSRT